MLKGSMPALVTPFKNGDVDMDALKKLVEWHIAEGSHALVPVGSTLPSAAAPTSRVTKLRALQPSWMA